MAKRSRNPGTWRLPGRAPEQKPLFRAADRWFPVTIPPESFGVDPRNWSAVIDAFITLNQQSFAVLELVPEVKSSIDGAVLKIAPGGKAGAVPLRSPLTGKVVGGFVVEPRFGWGGVGQVLSQIGWAAMPEFHNLPLVPGSGRETPAWVLAGPVLTRLEALLANLRRGYREVEEWREKPRGTILWGRYCRSALPRGQWGQVPCRFSDLDVDPRLRRQVRWTVEQLRRSLIGTGATDRLAAGLSERAQRMLTLLHDVPPEEPRPIELRRVLQSQRIMEPTYKLGIEAMLWVVEERGLGGGRELEGVPWSLSLDALWEAFVETAYRREAARLGGEVRVGRTEETLIRIPWSDPIHRSLGHLVPDVVVRYPDRLHIIDAKYKAHLADLDEVGWRHFQAEVREAHRADIHQVLAYSALFEAEEVKATLVYPLRLETWRSLVNQQRDRSVAEITQGGRRVVLELRGLPFGHSDTATTWDGASSS